MKPQIIKAQMNKFEIKSKFVRLALFFTTLLSVVLMTGSIYLDNRVYITDGEYKKEFFTSETDVNAILKQAELTLNPNDRVEYESPDKNTSYITIYRAFDVPVTADGRTVTVPVIEGTAADVLEKAGVALGDDDILNVPLEETVCKGMELTVNRVEYRTREEIAEIPFETSYVDNSNMVRGTEITVTEGVNGEKLTITEEKYIDGVLTEEKTLSDKVTVQPVTCVIERGTALAEPYSKLKNPQELSLINGIPESYTRIISGKATAYTAGRGAYTASGRAAEIGTCAVNPNVIPYGSKLYIVAQNGSKVYGYAVAADTGIALMDGRVTVDLYFGNMQEHYYDSCAWGAVQVDIYVIEEGRG